MPKQTNKVFISLIKGKEEKLDNAQELAKLVKYCQRVCWNYYLDIKLLRRTIKVKMRYYGNHK